MTSPHVGPPIETFGDAPGVDWRGRCLQGVSFVFADLAAADLRDADLREADFRGANLCGADLRGADRRAARWDGVVSVGCTVAVSRWWPSAQGLTERWRRARAEVRRLVGGLDAADDDEVLDGIDAVTQAFPDWSYPVAHLARKLWLSGRGELAAFVLVGAMVNDSDGSARRAYARILLERGEFAGARPLYQRLASEFPDDGQNWAELGYALGRLSEWSESRTALERAIQLGIDGANTWAALGVVAWSQGDVDTAERALSAASARDPSAAEHGEGLARVRAYRDALLGGTLGDAAPAHLKG